ADGVADGRQIDPVGARRPQVRVDAELVAQPQQSLLRPYVARVELGIADRALEDGVGLAAGGEGLFGKRIAGCPDRSRAEEVLLDLDVRRQLGERPSRGVGDLRPDAVAGEEDDAHYEWRGTTTR